MADKMMTRLSRTGLAILLVLCITLACGCTSTQVINLESPTPTISSGGQANNSGNAHDPSPSSGNTSTPVPTTTPGVSQESSSKKPVIVSVSMSSTEITTDERNASLIIIVDSASPPSRYTVSLDGPRGNLVNGIFKESAKSLGNGQWEYDVPVPASALADTGTYIWSNIGVMGENTLWSDRNPSITFRVVKPVPTPTGDKPVFAVVSMDKDQYQYTVNDSDAILTVIVNSQSPIVSKFLRLKDPNGKYLINENCTATVSSIGNDQWEFQVAYPIPQMSVPGTYTWDYMIVTNANNMTSDSGPVVKFQVSK